jgi:hypothetical protein
LLKLPQMELVPLLLEPFSTRYVSINVQVQIAHQINFFSLLKYQIGHICITLAVYIIIADTTSLRSRLFCSYIPALPSIVSPEGSWFRLKPYLLP